VSVCQCFFTFVVAVCAFVSEVIACCWCCGCQNLETAARIWMKCGTVCWIASFGGTKWLPMRVGLSCSFDPYLCRSYIMLLYFRLKQNFVALKNSEKYSFTIRSMSRHLNIFTNFISNAFVFIYSFIHLVVCLTTGPKPLPKPALHIARSRASSFKWEYPFLYLRSSNSFLRLLPRLPVTSIPSFIFPSITPCRRQFLRKMWPIQFAFRLLIRFSMRFIY